ncbi:hypothetical protein KCTC52924_02638 [Arenibacter antarcticus]|uniref:YkgJ family cysteine cluster protein n=1 Tax=Arenibacter antarcticus TaxID=2040469 RepID=A0ABW5VHU7_9FLAO|nr:YkgJ family cysteine cluster protein [Arenibacter sp. H213]MCM4168937.1 hypothetical protein [Arenibacter sp. H213]
MRLTLKDTTKTRDSVFAYQCHACNKCCHGKGIQVNPYETMRLSSNLGIITTEFRLKYLNGQLLKHKQNSNACIFLGENGCTVHEDRPLVCRLYPLGRLRMADGEVSFTELTPHPNSAGEYGTNSTVDSYLSTQEVQPYLDAEQNYMKLIQQMAKSAMSKLPPKSKKAHNYDIATKLNYTEWILDPDPVIVKYCNWRNIEFPAKTEQQLILHIEALKAWADGEWDPFANA